MARIARLLVLTVATAGLAGVASAQDGLRRWVDERDTDGDGAIDWRVTVWASAHGIVRQDVDRDADGTIDERIAGTYDERGAPLTWLVDRGADGTWDASTFYTNDAEGRRLRVEADLDGDGVAEIQRVLDAPCEAPYAGCDVVPTC